jgi:CDP-paratose 2-epimerase
MSVTERKYPAREQRDHVLITGGAGFIGSNLAHALLSQGRRVTLLDSLARPGVENNARWLRADFGKQVQLVEGDTRDAPLVKELVQSASSVFHFAAQVAVTTSLEAPRHDLDVNLYGTFNVLEALRRMSKPPPLLFTSTNKVYGNLSDLPLMDQGSKYQPMDNYLRRNGVDERQPLDFHSPYGCSKGAADQYILDYGRSYHLPVAVFRMSCIYGPRQFGTEDQGWVAHFLLCAQRGEPITIYGDGKQVRDVLFVDDLVEAMRSAETHMDKVSGRAFNIGGGPEQAISLLELLDYMAELDGKRPVVHFADARTGDQRYYVSNTERFRSLTGWRPRVGVRKGVRLLHKWLQTLPASDQERSLPATSLQVGSGARM